MRRALSILGVLACALALFWMLGPRPTFDRPAFDASAIGGDIDAYLADAEKDVAALKAGAEKQVLWASAPGGRTDLSFVVIHGFSASRQELRPIPERLAEEFSANVFLTRLAGHGRDGDALASATTGDWWLDMQEALEIGRRIGDRVVILSVSTGGTLGALALVDPAVSRDVAGFVAISPNFRFRETPLWLATMPFGDRILPPLIGETRSWEPMNEEHGKWWTTSYPTVAGLPMAATVAEALEIDFASIQTPALLIFRDDDMVVDPSETRRVASEWGGPVTIASLDPAPGEAPSNHSITGEITAPSTVDEAQRLIADWIRATVER